MESLRTKAKELLDSRAVNVVIGYAAGSEPDRRRPTFVRDAARVGELLYDSACRQNLATYLLKPEVKAFGKAAVVAPPPTLRALMQLAAENQLADGAVVALAVGDDGLATELASLAAIEERLATQPRGLSAAAQRELEHVTRRPREQRWAFWSAELGRCIKCYACRAACPLCYCTRCITDVNQPQWVPVAASPLGNLEWNVVRAMHLAGRCIDCGSCADACPERIRIDLLNQVLAHEVRTQFGTEPGYGVRKDYALAAFKPDDKEEFIR